MARELFYRQCKLQKGDMHQTSWLPEAFAVEGKTLRLREGDAWVEGWVVIKAYKPRRTAEQVAAHDKASRKFTKETPDSTLQQ